MMSTQIIDQIAEAGGIDADQAETVFALYRKHGVVKSAGARSGWRLVHGVALDRDTIRGALAAAEKEA